MMLYNRRLTNIVIAEQSEALLGVQKRSPSWNFRSIIILKKIDGVELQNVLEKIVSEKKIGFIWF